MQMRFFIALVLCAVFMPVLVPAPVLAAEPVAITRSENIVAVVNDDIITASDVEARARLMTLGTNIPNTPEAIQSIHRQVLSRLVDELLQMQEARKLGITIDAAQIQAGLQDIAAQNNTTVEALLDELTQAGVSRATLEDQVRAQLAWSMVVRRKLRPQVNVSESEIDGVLDQLESRAGQPEFLVAEIFLSVDSAEQSGNVQKDAQQLVDQLIGGASFAVLAREFSQGAGKTRGGDLGWIQAGQLAAELDAALSQMKPGQISPPVRSADGWHILFLRDLRVPQPVRVTDSVTEDQSETVTIMHLHQIMVPIAADDPDAVIAAKGARLKQLKSELNSCQDMADRFKEFEAPGTGDMGRIDTSRLPEGLRDLLLSLPDQQASDPIRNDVGFSLLMVCAREEIARSDIENLASASAAEARPAPLPDRQDQATREDIASQLGMQRLERLQERYLRDLRATAFIDVRI